ncbi:hypothetical protein BJY04DRAFT_224876 [Aspergillus karnatakaensis]|uniref:uncharacterized protein n=1 Tax=Aspergillus karnatakaensis TaxID=1810916 RepID=UPI003CCD1C20
MNQNHQDIPVMMMRPRRNWTAEEDVILKREVRRVQSEGDNISWHDVAAFLPGRTNKDCRKRWYGTAAAKVKKGPWTEAEDDRLRRAIDRHGTKWAVVASVVGTRLPDQCSKRWSHAIDPSIDHSPWTQQEDELLIQNVNKHGHYWQQIVSMYFPGRTSLAAKNRYHILQRRLKSEAAASPAQVVPWQELLASNATGRISSSSTPKGTAMVTAEDNAWLPLNAQSPLYDHSMRYDLQQNPYPVPQIDSFDSEDTPISCIFPPAMTIDELVYSTALPPTTLLSSATTPAFSPASLSDTSSVDELKSDTSQRRVCIKAICATDKLGAIFEAVTKFSISAVIKTDD